MNTENQNIEFKESWRDEYLKWICGFANAHGGTLYIGIDDHGEVCGVKNPKKLLEDIPNKICDTMGILADVNIREKDNKQYIEIQVFPSSYPVSYHGEYHYRTGSTKQQLQGAALTEFLIKKTGYQWDSVPVDWVTVDELDKESFDIFRREAVRTGRMSLIDVQCPNAELLDKLGLLEKGKLKRAAVLLFYRRPERFITGSYVKIGKFSSDNSGNLLFQDTVEGSLMLMADRTIDLIYLKYLTASISYHHDVRVETYPYAREAVREAVYNALIHSKWQDGIPIQIRIQDDVMYISNQCAFPSDWTVADILKPHRSRPYNPLIASTFYRAGYIESWGRGIEKIENECNSIGADAPNYEVKGDGFIVKFDALTAESNPISDLKSNLKSNLKIIELMTEKPEISVPELIKETGLSESGIKKIIRTLKKEGIIHRIGPDKGGHWEVINKK